MKIRKLVRRLLPSGLAVAILALATASPALAGSSASVETYGGAGGTTEANIQGGGGSTSPSSRSALPSSRGALPFTGTDLALAFAGGLILFAGGVAMARLDSRSTRSVAGGAGTQSPRP
jgi:hypothetical protein